MTQTPLYKAFLWRISRAAPKAVIGDSVALDPSTVYIYISFSQAATASDGP